MITGELTTIARPYAQAAFEYALEKNELASWEGMLRSAAEMVQQKNIANMLNSPQLTTKQLADLFCDVLEKLLNKEKRNFIHTLAEYKRLPVLPDIVELFASYRADREKTIEVEIRSAFPLEEFYKDKFINSLTKRLQRKVSLQCDVDPTLIGGAIVRAGDMVIDGSVRGKLNRLLESL
jgi:F-type H+-transporting ATPase subunit delta